MVNYLDKNRNQRYLSQSPNRARASAAGQEKGMKRALGAFNGEAGRKNLFESAVTH
jgi:hypothetical protein